MSENELFVSFQQELHHKINPLTLSCHSLKKTHCFKRVMINVRYTQKHLPKQQLPIIGQRTPNKLKNTLTL